MLSKRAQRLNGHRNIGVLETEKPAIAIRPRCSELILGGRWVEGKYVTAAKPNKRNGRHEETRTPDLYRVNLLLLNTFNNLTGLLGTAKFL